MKNIEFGVKMSEIKRNICEKDLEEMKQISALHIEDFFNELNAKAMIEEENERFMRLVMFSTNICSKCRTKTSDWKIFERIERNFTQSTSFGGNEETYDVTFKITSCPNCGFEIFKEEIKRDFVAKGWIK